MILHHCDTWSLSLGNQYKLQICDNKVVKKVTIPGRGNGV